MSHWAGGPVSWAGMQADARWGCGTVVMIMNMPTAPAAMRRQGRSVRLARVLAEAAARWSPTPSGSSGCCGPRRAAPSAVRAPRPGPGSARRLGEVQLAAAAEGGRVAG